MLYYLDHFMQIWLLPPGLNLLFAFIGWLSFRLWPRVGKSLVTFSLISLCLLSMPIVAQHLVNSLQFQYPTLSMPKQISSDAIVVLDAGLNPLAPEFEKPIVANSTLVRLHYAAFLHQRTGIPILVSGHYPMTASIDEADYMAKALSDYFGVKTKWKENQGASTMQEAKYATEILKKSGITKLYLVTHAFHMPRAIYAFQGRGIEIIPAPTGYVASAYHLGKVSTFLPTIDALHISTEALREYIGLLWYRLIDKLNHKASG